MSWRRHTHCLALAARSARHAVETRRWRTTSSAAARARAAATAAARAASPASASRARAASPRATTRPLGQRPAGTGRPHVAARRHEPSAIGTRNGVDDDAQSGSSPRSRSDAPDEGKVRPLLRRRPRGRRSRVSAPDDAQVAALRRRDLVRFLQTAQRGGVAPDGLRADAVRRARRPRSPACAPRSRSEGRTGRRRRRRRGVGAPAGGEAADRAASQKMPNAWA